MVLQFNDDANTKIRTVWLDKGIVYYVKLLDVKSMPKKMMLSKLEEMLLYEILIQVKDPFAKSIDEKSLSDRDIYDRDRKYKVVLELWEAEEKKFLKAKNKMSMFKEIADKHNMSTDTLRRLLTRYLVRGMNKNALLPDYVNSGGKGKEKTIRMTGKRGRPAEVQEISKGINIDDTIKNLIKKIYKNQYLSKQKKSYKECYYYLLKEYFSDKVVENAKVTYQVWDQNRIPSYNQFVYWCHKFKDAKMSS
jgi:hypothetical protein